VSSIVWKKFNAVLDKWSKDNGQFLKEMKIVVLQKMNGGQSIFI